MKINTKQFGELEFNEDLVIEFNSGPFGFENLKKYLLVKTEDDFFYWLNSIDQPEIVFPLIGIRLIDSKFPQQKGSEVFGIVTLDQDPKKITVNLKAPIYINQDSKTGFQKLIENDKYSVNYNLFID